MITTPTPTQSIESVIITGGLGVIGKALSTCLLSTTSAQLTIIDIKTRLAAEERKWLKDNEKRVKYHVNACTSLQSTRKLFKQLAPAAALVHLAGTFENDAAPITLVQREKIYHRALDHNLTNVYNVTEAYLERIGLGRNRKTSPAAKKEASPTSKQAYRMVFTSSLSFRQGAYEHVAYSAMKGGVVGLVRAYARRLGPRVLVNGVAPGIIASEMAAEVIRSRGESLRTKIPLQRYGTPHEVAYPILFLLSAGASYMTGQVLNIDGGLINS